MLLATKFRLSQFPSRTWVLRLRDLGHLQCFILRGLFSFFEGHLYYQSILPVVTPVLTPLALTPCQGRKSLQRERVLKSELISAFTLRFSRSSLVCSNFWADAYYFFYTIYLSNVWSSLACYLVFFLKRWQSMAKLQFRNENEVFLPWYSFVSSQTWGGMKSGMIHKISFWIKQLLTSDVRSKLLALRMWLILLQVV